jgi:hypothetical protein
MVGGKGQIKLVKSEDFDGDLNHLEEILNQYKWSADGVLWSLSDCGEELICNSDRDIYNPTLFPISKCTYVFEDDEGNSYSKKEDEMDDDDWGEWEEEVIEEHSVRELAVDIAEAIYEGSVRLEFNEIDSGVTSSTEVFLINSDCSGYRTRNVIMNGDLVVNSCENFGGFE